MTKNEIAAVLEEISTLLELKGENPFKIRAYTNAARSIEAWGGSLSDLKNEEALSKIPGIGKSIADKIKELAATGSLKYLEELRAEFPAAILELFSIPGLGAKKIKALYEELQISSIGQLLKACETGRVAKLPGFGETTQAKICRAIEERARHSGYFQFGQIANEAETLKSDLAGRPDALQAHVAGSYRRRKEIVHDVDLVVATRKPEAITKFFAGHPLVESIIAQGPTKSSVRLRSGIQCDLRVVTVAEYPFALAYFTGNKEHNIGLRSRALQCGWTLNEYRLAPSPPDPKAKKKRGTKKIPKVRDEAELYRALDLDFIPPELRENRSEFEAAEKHSLPKLIEKEDLRGTFHCHTTASDGHNTLEEMSQAAQTLGLEYLGIADHSRSSIQAHGIDEAALRAQIATIRKLNKKLDGFRLFAGIECDILRDGSLDFPDEVLSQLDYVVASVHSVFNLSEADMTRRVIRAMENPFVTMLAHPTGRLLLKREPYEIDISAILDVAARTGTWIELNAAPKRLDLDWRWWPRAKERGVKCVINPDAHRVERLQDLWFGVGIARKGWLTKTDVMNCLPLGKIEAALRAKRTR
ncbi:MAG: DNA polymerase/3'-5' exonuclease PolX [Verrucomicrobia bacterium]|nr:MAG: DNA polymerase/3'-5' exonuclease PolX [Verrucomicrobiota bacterium]PYJ78197.1 MAG: DNA polymerase/3'-5' exonuclease PolX [Verrucomicrobiota bacterium]